MKVKVQIKPKKTSENLPEKVEIKGDFIRLDALLKFVNAVESGGIAKMIIQDGEVSVNGEVCIQRGRKIRHSDIVKVGNSAYMIIREAAEK